MEWNFILINDREVLIGNHTEKLERCITCKTKMHLIRIYQKGHYQEFYLCPKCHEPELRIWRP